MVQIQSTQLAIGKIWLARILIGLVLLDNFQAAVIFLVMPGQIAPGFGLAGSTGRAVIQGIGLLFLMWCVPYFIALWNPVKYRVSFFEAIAMQFIALLGETILFIYLPEKSSALTSTIQRFIGFDGIGLLCLLIAATLLWIPKRKG